MTLAHDVLCVVSCASLKLDRVAQARELYCSPLFRSSFALATQLAPTFIASARHGLVHPDEELAPYNTALSDLSIPEQQRWGTDVARALHARFDDRERVPIPPLPTRAIHLFAGALYARHIRAGLAPLEDEYGVRYAVHEPLAGMPIGARLAFLRRALAPRYEVLR